MLKSISIAALALLLAPVVTKGGDRWTMTDLRLVGFYASGLPSPVEAGRRVATPGELNFVLQHFHSGSRYVCAVDSDLSSSRIVSEGCTRLRPGESPEARVAELRR